jgi:hypothetical protein
MEGVCCAVNTLSDQPANAQGVWITFTVLVVSSVENEIHDPRADRGTEEVGHVRVKPAF